MFGKKIRNVKIWIKGKRAWTDSVCCVEDNATIIISHLLSCPLHGLSNNEISWYHHCLYISWRKHHHFPLEYHNIYIELKKRFSLKSDRKKTDSTNWLIPLGTNTICKLIPFLFSVKIKVTQLKKNKRISSALSIAMARRLFLR